MWTHFQSFRYDTPIELWMDSSVEAATDMSSGKTHGGPGDAQRMVGDLGNVVADESGVAKVDFTDAVASLIGPHSIIGRSLVVYAGEDDRGRGGHENSSTTGNAGPRIAAGVIGLKV